MTDFKILLMRHGEIDPAYKGRFIGQKDVGLSEKGKTQALSIRSIMAHTQVESIFCSDLSRSHETAALISEGYNVTVKRMKTLREISLGEWEGMPIAEIKERFPTQWRLRGENIGEYRPTSGESFQDLARRVVPVFENIVQSSTSNILIAGHAGLNRVIICHILGIPLSNVLLIGQDYGRLSVLIFRDGSLGVRTLNCATI